MWTSGDDLCLLVAAAHGLSELLLQRLQLLGIDLSL